MLAAGTGITPMFQALQRMFGREETEESTQETSHTSVVLIYGCHSRDDIYLRHELEDMQLRFPERFRIIYAIPQEECSEQNTPVSFWRGRANSELVSQVCRDSSIDTGDGLVFVCGPPSFYDDMCGPRDTEEVSGVLRDLGFTNVVKF